MSHGERRVRIGILVSLIVILGSWMVLTAMVQRPRESDSVPIATQRAIDQASNANDKSITEVRGELKLIMSIATDARNEVREMRNALFGIAGILIVSLLLQVAQIRKSRTA